MGVLSLLLWAGAAEAGRPDEGGAWVNYDETDELAYVDGPGGVVRVHYSAAGTNQVQAGDTDKNSVPDFAEDVAAAAENVLDFYASVGFLLPVGEAQMGLSGEGGSDAFDFYLVDFGGSSDGQFVAEACSGVVCSGYMVMENDFSGYGYSSDAQAIRILTSHELFHGVQAAYHSGQPSWVSEGTAVWAEQAYDPDNEDFIWFCDAYLEDTGRSLYSPPAGAIESFSYSTALWWSFMEGQAGEGSMVAYQEALAEEASSLDSDGAMAVMLTVIDAAGADFSDLWTTFAQWNVATGKRAGLAASHSFAADLDEVEPSAEGTSIEDDNRFYPVAASYFRLDHAGGELFFATAEDPTGLVFSLHPVADGDDDGPVLDAVEAWSPTGPETRSLGEQDAGGYWLVGTYPQVAEQSVKVLFCLGDAASVAACAPADDTSGDDTGGDGGGEGDGGCGCAAVPGGGWQWAPFGLLLLGLRRRRTG
jgi:MYXO-CTERM domain-containing protein